MPKYKHGSGSVYTRGKKKICWIAYYVNGQQVCESARTTDKAEGPQTLASPLRPVG
jgi:hypothetical protein